MESSTRIPHQELMNWMRMLLKKAGFDNAQCEQFTEALLWSDLIGRSTHGVWRLPAYLARMEAKLIKCPCRPVVSVDRLAVAVMDGDQGPGHVVGHEAMSLAIAKAEQFGIGAVGVYNSNHFGTGAYFVNLAADQNMIGFAFSNSTAKVAAHGGSRPVFGTNPFAFGVPARDGRHMLLDMATSAVCGAQVLKYPESDLPLPEGMAVDTNGNSISDVHNVNDNTLQSFGGAKGYGMALMVEILAAVITGAMFSTNVNSMFTNFRDSGQNGHFFIAVDIGQMISTKTFTERIEALFNIIRNSGNASGDVLIPGQTRWSNYQENLLRGIPLDRPTLAALEALAARHGVPELRSPAYGETAAVLNQ